MEFPSLSIQLQFLEMFWLKRNPSHWEVMDVSDKRASAHSQCCCPELADWTDNTWLGVGVIKGPVSAVLVGTSSLSGLQPEHWHLLGPVLASVLSAGTSFLLLLYWFLKWIYIDRLIHRPSTMTRKHDNLVTDGDMDVRISGFNFNINRYTFENHCCMNTKYKL